MYIEQGVRYDIDCLKKWSVPIFINLLFNKIIEIEFTFAIQWVLFAWLPKLGSNFDSGSFAKKGIATAV